jgi:hypothetical protein
VNLTTNYQDTIDKIYYAHAGKLPLAQRISFIARKRVVSLFFDIMQPRQTSKVLDVGASEVISFEANMLEQVYPYRHNLVCASITPGKNIVRAYPGVDHVQIEPNRRLPFEDNSFDISYSNAVLEHVGDRSRQAFFVSELCRVSRSVFIVVPNRWFPVEHHTGIPMLHWLPQSLFRSIIQPTPWHYWSKEEHLNYIGAPDLCHMWPQHFTMQVVHEGVGFGQFKSNLVIYGSENVG